MKTGMKKLIMLTISGMLYTNISVADDAYRIITEDDDHQALLCNLCAAKQRLHEYNPGFEVGFDFRFRTTYLDAPLLDRKAPAHDRLFQRYRVRAWAKTKHFEDMYSNIRIVTEPRYFFRPDNLEDQFIRDETLIDKLNLEWDGLFGKDVSLVAGRQDIRFGTGWLVIEGTTFDGSRTAYFDALRLTQKNEDDSKYDYVVYSNHANSSYWMKPINDSDLDLNEQDDQGVMLYLADIPYQQALIDGYFFYKHDTERVRPDGNEGEIYTFGTSYRNSINDRTKYYLELTPQFGHKNGKKFTAAAANTRLDYDLGNDNNSSIHFVYEYRSGDDDPDKNFDKLWGRYPQWSELYDIRICRIDGRGGDASNLHRLNMGVATKPAEDIKLEWDYHLLFADENTSSGGTNGLSESGHFRGQLLTLQLKYFASEDIRHRINGEVFFPGDFYNNDRNDVATFLRYELYFTW